MPCGEGLELAGDVRDGRALPLDEEHIAEMGFRVYVANHAKLKLLTESDTKNDRNDARSLARYTLADVGMLHPVFLRPESHTGRS